jgi:hypothetical protein
LVDCFDDWPVKAVSHQELAVPPPVLPGAQGALLSARKSRRRHMVRKYAYAWITPGFFSVP